MPTSSSDKVVQCTKILYDYVLRMLKTFRFDPLVMVSIYGRKRTLADKTVYQNGSIDTSFDPPLFSLDRTFKYFLRII
jgi:hypothetical protein